jgi:predicted MFS family arabinose efflux permease
MVRRLAFANTLGGFDRFVMPPLLATAAADLDASLVQVSLAATAYYLVYGAAQPLWGVLAGRLGGVTTVRIALAGGCTAAFFSALAPGLELFVAARGLSALFFAAIVPTSLIYLAEAVSPNERQAGVADVLAGSAIGMTVASISGGILAGMGLWRGALFGLGVVALVQLVALRGLTAPQLRPVEAHGERPRRWGVAVLALGFVNSAVTLAALSFIPVAAVGYGDAVTLAGFAVAWYGVAYWGGTRVVKPLTFRTPVPQLVGAGAATIAVGLAVATVARGWPGLSVATALVGFGFAFTNSSLQRWVMEVVPGDHILFVSLFTAVGWTGGALATAAVAPVADAGHFAALFGACALTAGLFALCAPLARLRWQASVQGAPAPR